MKIAFITLGCKLNFAETATYERGFRAAGLEVVPWREKADIYLINTCTVTETSNKKSRGEIRKVHRINPDARIIVVGCYAQLRPDDIRAIPGVSRVFTASEKDLVVPETISAVQVAVPGGTPFASSTPQIPDLRGPRNSLTPAPPIASDGPLPLPVSGGGHVRQGQHLPGATVIPRSDATKEPIFAAYSTSERTRAFLKIQDGCDNFCRYCTVPYARGRSRSVPLCEVVKAAEAIAAEGVKEVVLTGVNTGDYGRGTGTGDSFLDLLKALNKIEGIERWRISIAGLFDGLDGAQRHVVVMRVEDFDLVFFRRLQELLHDFLAL